MARGALALAHRGPLGARAEPQPLGPSYVQPWSLSEARPKTLVSLRVPHPGARWRDKGKYRAITLRLHFENADQVYDVYAAINRDPRVKFKL